MVGWSSSRPLASYKCDQGLGLRLLELRLLFFALFPQYTLLSAKEELPTVEKMVTPHSPFSLGLYENFTTTLSH